MILNSIFAFFQKLFYPVYEKSYVLKKLDWLIFINILLVIFTSAAAPSDNIGYFAIFAIILTVLKLLFKPNARVGLTYSEAFLLLYFIFVLISVAGSTLFLYSFKGFCKTLIYLGFYFSLVNFLKDNRGKLKYIILAIALVAIAESFFAIYQNSLSVSEISGWQDMSRLNPEEVMTRVYGTLKPYNPNLFGGYILAALPSTLLLVFLPVLNRRYKTAGYGLIFFVLCALSIVLTGCRGAYIGLFFELLLLVTFTYRFLKPYYKKIFLTVTSALAGLMALFILSVTSLRARIFSIFAMRDDSSNSFRFNVYNSCIQMFKDNWLLGIGVGNQNFREIYGLYMKTGFDALSAYNIYLETAVESGIFALLSFLGFIFTNVYLAVRYIYRKRNPNVLYLAIALISLCGILLHGFVDTVFFRPQIQFIFWIMMGVIRVITMPRRVSDVCRRRN